jgi:hypothetical protein
VRVATRIREGERDDQLYEWRYGVPWSSGKVFCLWGGGGEESSLGALSPKDAFRVGRRVIRAWEVSEEKKHWKEINTLSPFPPTSCFANLFCSQVCFGDEKVVRSHVASCKSGNFQRKKRPQVAVAP